MDSVFLFQLVVLSLLAAASAAPQGPDARDATILRQDSDVRPDGYNLAYETSNGNKHEEQGQLVNVGTDNESISVRGSYAWVGPDGVTYVVTYVADENGFQPTIEQGPGGGVPPAVVASLLG
ncbi:Flexible cuticle protein 12 [Eumeta japonica]|uniref:Flexible cuticle protein 12 n=1 Tax=Eumeta variegata TaxID=151549 RepID=A0A4C1Y885_EUMVA|nr:Flexible cuticle protein 12 [Eumeta japonica]